MRLAFVLALLGLACSPAGPQAAPDAGSAAIPEFVDPSGDPPPVAWNEGPSGTRPRDVAGPFTLPLSDGTTFDFRASFSGSDSFLFVVDAAASDSATKLWASPVRAMLDRMPPGVHLFFLSADASSAEDVAAMKSRIDGALDLLPAPTRAKWEGRIHYVSRQATTLDGWLGTYLNEQKPAAFAIDRAQRLRETGLLASVTGGGAPKLEFLADEALGFAFEARREWLLSLRPATVVPVFSGEKIAAWTDRTFEASLPDLAPFDTLELDFTEGCDAHRDRNCGDWDLIVDLFVCDGKSPETCDARLGRWITTYKREGRWVTDVSPLLALLGDGGTRRFRLSSGQSFTGDLSLRFSSRHKGMRPASAIPLFAGGPFDAHYNETRAPLPFEVPPGTRRVQLVASPTGHGYGDDEANCAEFCDHEHRFRVNDTEFVRDFPDAGTDDGCRRMVGLGVVPNQFGTWVLGRGGWCPGLDVAPWAVDVTGALVYGTQSVSYRGTFHGADYQPKKVANGSNFPARIDLSSWIVFWR